MAEHAYNTSAFPRRVALFTAPLTTWLATHRPGSARARAVAEIRIPVVGQLGADQQMVRIVGQLKEAERKLNVAIGIEEAGHRSMPSCDELDIEIKILIAAAAELTPVTDQGYAAKAWIALAYADLGIPGDQLFRSLMVNLIARPTLTMGEPA